MSPEERAELIEAMKEVFPTREDYAELRSGLRQEMDERFGEQTKTLRQEMDERFGAMREKMDGRFGELRGEMNARFDLVPTREEMLEKGDEWLRRYDVTAEELGSQIERVAEGVDNVFQALGRLRVERDESRAEELDVLRAGYRQLDRRLRKVEGKLGAEPQPPLEVHPDR